MSNFPLNNDRYEHNENVNGSPITMREAMEFSDKILYWHTDSSTSDFSQSGDGFDDGVRDLAYGLLELLSDPNAIKRIQTTGRQVKQTVREISLSKDISKRWENVKVVLKEVFA
jgi:hypothetical protein